MDKQYKSLDESPKELTISRYWSNGGGMSYLREGLPINHPENQYNWFTRTYPELNPSYYDVKHPLYEEFEDMTREELINKIAELRAEITNMYQYR